jgi:hypothetical protein
MPRFENCKNCDATISCSCQYTLASDGQSCCDDCIQAYETTLVIMSTITIGEEKEKKNKRS